MLTINVDTPRHSALFEVVWGTDSGETGGIGEAQLRAPWGKLSPTKLRSDDEFRPEGRREV